MKTRLKFAALFVGGVLFTGFNCFGTRKCRKNVLVDLGKGTIDCNKY